MLARWSAYFLTVLLGLGVAAALLFGFAAILAYPNLPSLEVLTDYQPKIPLRVYSAEGLLIGEFGEERRSVVKIASVPNALKQAILAAEDERFYQHGGVDYLGVLRAAYSNFASGGARQGASTITMQVARNFFLSKEKTLTRKFNEALLAFKIEHSLSKDEILELYVNQIYLGQRAYGFAAAAQVYFGKTLDKVNLAEAAMLAGLPKAPSRYNPVVNPKRAKMRQLYVLRRMLELNYVTDKQFKEAEKQNLAVKRDHQEFAVKADHLAELVRQAMYERYQEDAYTKGFQIYTTLRKQDQEAAYQAVRKGVLEYDRRHGYRGPEGFVELTGNGENQEELLEDALQEIEISDDIFPAVVLSANPKAVKVYRKGAEAIDITGDGLKFAQKMLADKVSPNVRIRPGAIIRVQKDERGAWHIVQMPQAEAALVSINPVDGAIYAMVGGFDFVRNKFNHVTQAWRQPGSSFKPFIYSAALEKGFNPATVINDAPLVFDAAQTGSEPWEPKNFDGKYDGPIRMRMALTKSKNLVSIRILQAIGPRYAQDYIARFGFDANLHPPYLTMALGAGSVTPLQMAVGYSAFANGGYRVSPYFIQRVLDEKGKVLADAQPVQAGDSAERVIDARNAFLMTSMMQDVVRRGTAAKAMQLGRHDLAGKTGTTSDFIDAWFCGFQPNLVAITWIGFDKPRTLGHNETGAQAALPIWMGYMGKALKDVPEGMYTPPEGVIAANINAATGLREPGGGLTEFFYQENLPREQDENQSGQAKPAEEVKDQLF